MIDIVKRRFLILHAKFKPHWRKLALFGGGGLLSLVVLIQLLYPSNHLVPFITVDGVDLGGWQKDTAIKQLDDKYTAKTIPIYFGKITKAYRSPKPAEIGLTISNASKINAINYPWYLRIIPTSILWAHLIINHATEPVYQRNDAVLNTYINKELGTSCDVKPQNASLKVSGAKLEVISSEKGGICDINNVRQILTTAKPQLDHNYRLTVPVREVLPSVSDAMARQIGDNLQSKIGTGVLVAANGSTQIIPISELFSWTDFSSIDDKLTYSLSANRATTYLNKEFAAKVAIKAGTTTVSTHDFVETARVNGSPGRQLDIDGTLLNIKSFLDGNTTQAAAATAPVAPNIVYTRSYSSTDVGLSALIQQYAEAHDGVYGVSMIELSGQNRRASYNETKSFITASTYKLFVAYSSLKRIEDGTWHWTDQITDGRNLSVCLDDMIIKSDNACGSALLEKIGYTNLTNEAHALGCKGTSFLNKDGIKTTSADLALFLAELQTGQMLTQQSSRDRLINDMKSNIYRQGVPAGLSGITVADKVGFMDGLLHDATIVFSPTGTYILVIMSDGSSWSTIADFAKQIEALRIQ